MEAQNSGSTRHLPPYGHGVKAARESGRLSPNGQSSVWVTCGSDAWEQGKKTRTWGHTAMVLPPDENPTTFRWPVAGLDVVVLVAGDIDSSTLEALGIELVHAGSLLVVICDPYNETLGGPIATFNPRRKAA